MSKASDYLEEKLMRHTFGAVAFTAPTVLGVALHTTDPTDADSGLEAGTAGAGTYQAYSRVQADAGTVNWTFWQAGTTGSISNKLAFTFPQGTGTDSQTLAFFGVYDATVVGVGNLLCYGPLNSNLAVSPGVTPEFAIGALVITLA